MHTSAPQPSRLMPTTRPQVSGHRFMRRRVEHGLLFGDIRMIHDPLATRRRATIFGLVAVALIAAVMALFAWLRPNSDPGDAPILRDPAGNLFVRVDGTVHPVANLASARLVAGAAEEPARTSDEHLATLPRGVPIGVQNAPSVFAPEDAADVVWSVCAADEVTVVAGAEPRALGDGEAVLAEVDGAQWIFTREGRTLLPAEETPEGRIVRRVLGITADTPRWRPPADVAAAARELPPIAFPSPLPEVLTSEAGAWLVAPWGGIQVITDTQRTALADAGATLHDVPRTAPAEQPDAAPAFDLRLPAAVPQWLRPGGETVCVTESGGAAAAPAADLERGAAALSGDAVATRFAGLAQGAVGVDTGRGYHVVSIHGLRQEVEGRDALTVLGARRVESAPWRILTLLPEGPKLSRGAAVRATY